MSTEAQGNQEKHKEDIQKHKYIQIFYNNIIQKEFSETSSMILNRVAMSEIITRIPGKIMAKRPIQKLLSPQLQAIELAWKSDANI